MQPNTLPIYDAKGAFNSALSVTKRYAYNHEDAVDLAQDSIISMFTSKAEILDSEAYIKTVAHRKGLTYARVKGGRYGRLEYVKVVGSDDKHVLYNDSTKRTVLIGDEYGYGEIEVDDFIGKLTPQDQTVVRLLMGGYEQQEVCQMMGFHRSTLARTLKRLQEQNPFVV